MIRGLSTKAARDVPRYRGGLWSRDADVVTVEEPLEIQVAWDDGLTQGRQSISVTMRTPGNDFELAAGFLFAEGIVSERCDIQRIRYCLTEQADANTVLVTLREGLSPNLDRQERYFPTTSACGVCGKASLDSLAIRGCDPLPAATSIAAATICRLPALLRGGQPGFGATGGIHASGLFEADGTLVSVREDVGRHNAFDKLTGEQFLAGAAPELASRVAVLSGRASYELLQKALVARIPIVVALGAPSSLAVDIATTFNITLTGFARESGFNVYAGEERIRG